MDWEQDRDEILRHWRRLGIFHRLVLIWILPIFLKSTLKSESLCYLATRLYGLPTKCVFVSREEDETGYVTVCWDSIRNFLRRNIWDK